MRSVLLLGLVLAVGCAKPDGTGGPSRATQPAADPSLDRLEAGRIAMVVQTAFVEPANGGKFPTGSKGELMPLLTAGTFAAVISDPGRADDPARIVRVVPKDGDLVGIEVAIKRAELRPAPPQP